MKDFLVLTPLLEEFKSLKETLLKKYECIDFEETAFFPALNLRLCKGGHGKVQFAIKTVLAIQKFKPNYVICAGMAGSLNKDIKSLDIIAAIETVEHDYKLKFIKKPFPRFKGSEELLELIRSQNIAILGSIASGDEDVISQERARELHMLTGCAAVAWEGVGGARAAKFFKLPYLELRAISDVSDSNAKVDFLKNLNLAALKLSEVLVKICEQ